ncbi:hypothetical protein AB0F72_09240 [Actinoplanes sp. NPDC023936]|uniref:hypothetical protein n=1 Tax=Actinoplanes sp. NPDC023936 TaxID=3154910 RepID=UPI0033ED0472
MIPRSGDIVRIGASCGAMFRIYKPFMRFRVAGATRYPSTPDDMLYLSGYHIDMHGVALEHRPELLVIHVNLILEPRPATERRPRNDGVVRVPAQRGGNESGQVRRPNQGARGGRR